MIDWLRDNWQWVVTWWLLFVLSSRVNVAIDEIRALRRGEAPGTAKREALTPRDSQA